MAVRRFNKVDWYGLAGCTRFSDGSEPFICEMHLEGPVEATVVGDAECIQVHVLKTEDSDDTYGLEYWTMVHCLPPFAVEAIIRRMVKEVNTEDQLKAAGFTKG